MTDDGDTRTSAVRIRVPTGGPRSPSEGSGVGSAFVGFLLGSLAAIISRPPSDTDEGTIVAYIVGGLVGAIVATVAVPLSRRLLGQRLGIRGRAWAAAGAAALVSFVAGTLVGFLAQAGADIFLGTVIQGNELLPAVVAAAFLAVLTSLLFVTVEETARGRGPDRRRPWPLVFAGGLSGGVVGMLGGAMASAVTEAYKSYLFGVEAGARGGMILAGWTGSAVGLLATAAFLLAARQLRRIRSRASVSS